MSHSEDNSTKILIIILAVLGGGMFVCCGVGVGAFFWMRSAFEDLSDFVDDGMADFDQQVQTDIEDNPVIVEHIGRITHFESDFDLSIEEDYDEVWVFDVSGDRGSGTLRAECITVDEWTESVPRAELTLDNGEVFQLFPDNPLPAENQRDIGVRAALEDHPVILEHIGEITRLESDYDLWLEEPGYDVWPFHVEGEKGSGLLRAECVTEDHFIYEVPSAVLKLESGETIQLFPDNPLE
ncbi:MAG: hypothetical protein DWQ34_05095 [Planctomycetota bacterium]|nr:MAG: hypothetical protein DWQ29_02815 [Planctomycetota bacterium]REJ95949.1 MAG: hypothetical protein DWQ34_05095 [Planctomycetota bacterium]REK29233.1 MAG: hypothetical protein DWQ41_04585 [Planctomycetota bacterium]REK29417.1 MAG: hypothetical protein DWQ45_22875 [Planctomycetota bacterium]